MNQCPVCGSKEFIEKQVNEIFHIDGTPVLVENIPARVCARCGDVSFSRETMEKVRQMVHGQGRPVRAVQMDVFEYA